MKKVLVLSPSGNFYGSEQVLLDYLQLTKLRFDVMIPANSLLASIVANIKTAHRFTSFNDKKIKQTYLQLFVKLLAGKYDTVYINEAGHSRYILLLAKFFPNKRFVIHVRIAEDTAASRWKMFSAGNIKLISISENIKEQLPCPSELIYDLYIFSKETGMLPVMPSRDHFTIGIIGRITFSKGLNELVELMEYARKHAAGSVYTYKLYGEVPAELSGHPAIKALEQCGNIEFMGFVQTKKDIYDSIDMVLHLSKTEPLGRIFLEAIDERKPLVGFNSAGIGEIGKLTGLNELLCDPSTENFARELFAGMERVRNDYQRFIKKIDAANARAATVFNPVSYTERMDNILAG